MTPPAFLQPWQELDTIFCNPEVAFPYYHMALTDFPGAGCSFIITNSLSTLYLERWITYGRWDAM